MIRGGVVCDRSGMLAGDKKLTGKKKKMTRRATT